MQRLALILLIVIFSFTPFTYAENISLLKAEELCARQNKEILVKEKEVEYLKHKLKELWGINFPPVRLSGTRVSDYEATYYSVSLTSLNINYIEGKTKKANAVKEYKDILLDLIMLKRKKIKEVRILFPKVFLLKERLKYVKEIHDLTLDKLNKDEKKLEKGIILPLEKMESELRLNRDKLRLLSIESEIEKNIEDLKSLLGLDIKEKIELGEMYEREFDLNNTMIKLFDNQPQIEFVDNEIYYLSKTRKGIFDPLMPNINLEYTYTYEHRDNPPQPEDNSWTVGLSLSLPIFDYFTISAKRKADKALMNKHILEKERVKEQLTFVLKKAYIDYQLSEKNVAASKQSYSISKERLALLDIQKEYKEISDYESDRAKTELDQNERALYNAQLDALIKKEELFYIAGDY